MAVVWIFRIALVVAPAVARWCFTNGCDASTASNAIARWWSELNDPETDPDELSVQMTAGVGGPEGGVISVTDFTGTFELRKLQWRLSRQPAGRLEDVDVMTFHFIKATAGTPAAWVDSTDLPLIETAVGTYWTATKTFCASFIHSDQYRFYKDGPAFYVHNPNSPVWMPIGDNPAVRVTEVDVAGTASGTSQMPPQLAWTTTEVTSSRRHWGRWYHPATLTTTCDSTGLMAAANVATVLGAAVTMYNSLRASSIIPVVFSIQKDERPKAGGGTLPAQAPAAYEVLSLQVDDILDVVRSRRYDAAVTKTRTALT